MKERAKRGAGIFGFGAAACVACCAGPIFAFLGGLSIAGAASTLIFGGVGLAVSASAIAAILLVRRRRRTDCAISGDEPVAVAAPTRRPQATR